MEEYRGLSFLGLPECLFDLLRPFFPEEKGEDCEAVEDVPI